MLRMLLFGLLSLSLAQEVEVAKVSRIGGVVNDDLGNPLPEARLTLSYTSGRTGVRRTEWHAVSDGQGRFQFQGLPRGEFGLCIQPRSGPWLNPCLWGSGPIVASISKENRMASLAIVLKKGVFQPIDVEDPAQLLLKNAASSGAHLLLGTTARNGVFVPAVRVSEGDRSRSYSLLLPAGVPVSLSLGSGFYTLSDGLGVPVQGLQKVSLTVATANVAPIRLVITGTVK